MKGKQSLQQNEYLQIKLQQDNKKKILNLNTFIMHQLLFGAIVLFIISSFSLTTNFMLSFLLSEFLIVLLNINFRNKTLRKYILIGFSSVLMILLIVLNRYFINGLFVIYEQVAHTFAIQMSKIINPYEVTLSGNEVIFAEQLFSLYMFFGIVLLSYFIVKIRSNWLITLLVISVIMFEVWTNITPTLFVQVSFFFIMLVIYALFHVEDKANLKESMIVAVVMLILFGGSYGLAQLFESSEIYEKHSIVKQIESNLTNKWYDFRYEKKHTHNYPNGDFTDLESLDMNEEVALEVIMSNPISLYLRGFVGTTYTSERWENLDAREYDDAFDMLYWLEKDAFHPLIQLNTLKQVVDDSDEVTNKVSIQNVNGDSQYLYTPYELSKPPKEERETFKELDQAFMSDKFFGERHYTFDTSENLVTQYPSLAYGLYDNRKKDEVVNYLTYESYYNSFVYDVYTDVPENISMMLENHIGKIVMEDTDEHVPYEWAIHKISSYLEENIMYDTEVKSIPIEEDFLMEFLENEREGYAPHFATAATVMFRYFGIPARYVEGYLIPPDLVKGVEAYEKLLVNGTQAHAWTEIYIDEVGWIPIEVTPGFEDVMEEVDLSNYPSGASESDVESMYEEPEEGFNDAKQEVEDDSFVDETNNEPEESMHWFIWLLIIMAILLIIVLLIYIIYKWRQRQQLKKFVQSFKEDEVAKVVNRIFSYVTYLIGYDEIHIEGGSVATYLPEIEQRYGREYRILFEEAWKLHQLSLYSQEPLTEEMRKVMFDFYQVSLMKVTNDKSVLMRLKMKYVDVSFVKL